MKKILSGFIEDIKKLDSILAFFVSLALFYIFTKKIWNALLFSICFVLVFLMLLNIIKH